jgi:hypothetical protein
MPIFTHFYIVTEDGTSIYSKSVEKDVGQHLLPGFMTAMETFSKKMLSGDLESVSIGNSKYLVLSAHSLLFIVRTGVSAKDTAVKRELEMLQEIFFKAFPADRYSQKWNSLKDISPVLDATYEPFFKESDTKMREAVW